MQSTCIAHAEYMLKYLPCRGDVHAGVAPAPAKDTPRATHELLARADAVAFKGVSAHRATSNGGSSFYGSACTAARQGMQLTNRICMAKSSIVMSLRTLKNRFS